MRKLVYICEGKEYRTLKEVEGRPYTERVVQIPPEKRTPVKNCVRIAKSKTK